MDDFYFAYGSNMDPSQMAKRRAHFLDAQRALLRRFRLAFDKRSDSGHTVYANIQPADDIVWGVLYSCTPTTLDVLDGWEGVSGGHYRRSKVTVELDDGHRQEATTYVAGSRFLTTPSRPTARYLARILAGARANHLPEEYVARIQAIAGNAA